jgi:alkanesulfonate monooxygenase SsuD/methylene tetrahydromethanopterin reductase-like flavin-dependent oxidoreductase (luciferase family)
MHLLRCVSETGYTIDEILLLADPPGLIGSGHQSPGLWRHPKDQSWRFNEVTHWVELAKLLEEAKFHGIFIADVLGMYTSHAIYFPDIKLRTSTGGYDVYRGSLGPAKVSGAQWPVNEPLSVVSAMAAATQSIGFGVTASTTYEQPYHLARRLSTVDHLSRGRLGWNVGVIEPHERIEECKMLMNNARL